MVFGHAKHSKLAGKFRSTDLTVWRAYVGYLEMYGLRFDGVALTYLTFKGEKTVLLRADPPTIKTDILIRIRLVGELPRDSPTVKQMQNILLRKVRREICMNKIS